MYLKIALPLLGSAILLYSCDDADENRQTVNEETLMTEQSENMSVLMSENGRRSYFFKTPLLEGYTLASDPYREFRKGIDITTYQDDSLSSVNANLTANYAIYYENRKLWEAKGDVVVIKADGTELYTQQLFWNSMTKRIYSNVDTKIVKGTDVFFGEGFESDEELKQWKFRRMSGRMFVKLTPGDEDEEGADGAEAEDGESEDGTENNGDNKGGDAAKGESGDKGKSVRSAAGTDVNAAPKREQTTRRTNAAAGEGSNRRAGAVQKQEENTELPQRSRPQQMQMRRQGDAQQPERPQAEMRTVKESMVNKDKNIDQ